MWWIYNFHEQGHWSYSFFHGSYGDISPESLRGAEPTRRAKTPTGRHNLETEIHEIYTDEETFDEEMEEIPVIPPQ